MSFDGASVFRRIRGPVAGRPIRVRGQEETPVKNTPAPFFFPSCGHRGHRRTRDDPRPTPQGRPRVQALRTRPAPAREPTRVEVVWGFFASYRRALGVRGGVCGWGNGCTYCCTVLTVPQGVYDVKCTMYSFGRGCRGMQVRRVLGVGRVRQEGPENRSGTRNGLGARNGLGVCRLTPRASSRSIASHDCPARQRREYPRPRMRRG